RNSAPAAPAGEVIRALESAKLLRAGDDLLECDPVGARILYLEALERAPQHRETIARIASLDARVPGRAEAALALLAELRRDDHARLGTVPGDLLAATGDREAAVASLEWSAELEECPALSARALERAARFASDAEEAARLLDRAIARSPR